MKSLNFNAVEVLPALLDKSKTQTIRKAWKTNIQLAKEILQEEKVKNWKIKLTQGKEGLTIFKTKQILLGKKCSQETTLHEFAHLFSGKHHYHKEFNKELKRLQQKYSFLKTKGFSVGDRVKLYWKQRSKYNMWCLNCLKAISQADGRVLGRCPHCKSEDKFFNQLLGEVEITEFFEIEISPNGTMIDGTTDSIQEIAERDGFESPVKMLNWFIEKYKLTEPKTFYVYRWKWK